MARKPRSPLETRSNRLKLAVRRKPYSFVSIAVGVSLGYRRCVGNGRWICRVPDGRGGRWEKVCGVADDFEDSNSETVLDFHQAMDAAKKLARGGNATSDRPSTVAEALDVYEADLLKRGGSKKNATRVRSHMPPALLAKPLALLTTTELRRWRDGIEGKPSTINRVCKAAKGAFNLCADHDRRVAANRDAWRTALAALPDAHSPRVAVLEPHEAHALIPAAYEIDAAFGLFAETGATTGARPIQLSRLEVGDLQDRGDKPRLMMPTSKKGRGVKRIDRRAVVIPPSLAAKLRNAAGKRGASEPLLLKSDGTSWSSAHWNDYGVPFAEACERVGIVGHSFYSLRHTSIVRQLLRSVPIRIVADAHDTSVVEIERTYSRWISDHSDALTRAALVDFSQPSAGNVVPLRG